ncbi:HNH endonuclease signature motif containing protein [Streptomyces altiplanensis]
MALTDITTTEILCAIEEFDRMGRESFLHGRFRPARRYLLAHNGRQYDSKAIVGVAHGYLPGRTALAARDFSGGEAHAVAVLRRCGFEVVELSSQPAHGEDGISVEHLVGRIEKLRVHRVAGRPALYQPITLLWAVGRARHRQSRLLPWSETDDALRGLLVRHGVHGERPRPDYPVAALFHAGLWELEGHTGPVPKAHGDAALRRWFSEHRPGGGLVEPFHDLVRDSGDARLMVVDAILTTYFDGLDPSGLLSEVGLGEDEAVGGSGPAGASNSSPLASLTAAARYERLCNHLDRRAGEPGRRQPVRASAAPYRSGVARRAVLVRSEGRCENPGCTGQPADVTVSGGPLLEVDHVQDLALGGDDHPSQMVALCPNCHAMKTRGSSREALRAVLLAVAKERHARPDRLSAARVAQTVDHGAAL